MTPEEIQQAVAEGSDAASYIAGNTTETLRAIFGFAADSTKHSGSRIGESAFKGVILGVQNVQRLIFLSNFKFLYTITYIKLQARIMVKSDIIKYLLRYLLFVGIPYAIAKKIEKSYLRSRGRPHDKPDSLDNKPDSLPVYFRGGEFITVAGVVDFLMKDLGFRVAFTGLIGSSIWSDTADTATGQVVKYAGAIAAAPGGKFLKILKRFRGMNGDHTLDIKEILLQKNTSNEEKFELIRMKVQYALKNLKGKKRVTFITTTVALLVFFLGNGTPAFVYFMAGLREMLGARDDQDSLKEYIIDIYREYNAPLPEELITQITNQL
jgi:hypothetical protein